jgi:hypothetical protein
LIERSASAIAPLSTTRSWVVLVILAMDANLVERFVPARAFNAACHRFVWHYLTETTATASRKIVTKPLRCNLRQTGTSNHRRPGIPDAPSVYEASTTEPIIHEPMRRNLPMIVPHGRGPKHVNRCSCQVDPAPAIEDHFAADPCSAMSRMISNRAV